MAGYYSYTAVLDACVLYPVHLRDLLLSLSSEGAFQARWTDAITEEWMRNVIKNRPEIDQERLRRSVGLMQTAIEDCLIEKYEYLIDTLDINMPNDDKHVVAAAILGHADAIVTANIKHFPYEITEKHGIEILHPDDFLIAQYDLSPVKFLKTFKGMRERMKKPPRTAKELIAVYQAQNLPQICKRLEEAEELI